MIYKLDHIPINFERHATRLLGGKIERSNFPALYDFEPLSN